MSVRVPAEHGSSNQVKQGFGGEYWEFIRANGLILLVSYAVPVLATAVSLAAYSPIMAWFGLIYLMAAITSLCVLGLLVARGPRMLTNRMSFAWLVLAGAIAVGLTAIYSLTIGNSDSPASLVVTAQLIHSLIFFGTTILVGAVCHIWRWRKRTSKDQSPAARAAGHQSAADF